tara:strand:- start:21703 stop:22065 length:363 start_codon:yes stop_codon:yes gene_type:complete
MSETFPVTTPQKVRRRGNNAYCVSNLGVRVREVRTLKKMSQRALAAAARMPPSTITRLEMGHLEGVYTNSLASLAYALNCTSDYLLFGNERDTSEVVRTVYDVSAETRGSEVIIRVRPKE